MKLSLFKIAELYEESFPQTERSPNLLSLEPDSEKPISQVQVIDAKKPISDADKYGLESQEYLRVGEPRLEMITVLQKMTDTTLAVIQAIAKGGQKKDVDRNLVTIRKLLNQADTLAVTNLTPWIQ